MFQVIHSIFYGKKSEVCLRIKKERRNNAITDLLAGQNKLRQIQMISKAEGFAN